ncbi:MAG: class I SAM-dependent methyltransferase [Gemmatimonadaceae bacterium]
MQLVELEDLAWWPRPVRDLATDYLHFMEARLALHRPVVAPLAEALRTCGARHLVDLCAGASGPVPALLDALRLNGLNVSATLTDLYPNVETLARVAAESGGVITFETEPVDAQAVPRRLRGFRTVFNAFHHFSPAMALAVLCDARAAGQPIGVFEIPQRALATTIPLLVTPLFVWAATPFIRPFRWRRLLWTYVIPLVPLTCWWDGLVSQLRAYEPSELTDLAAQVPQGFTWRSGRVPIGNTPGRLTYLIGLPRNAR